MKILKKKERKKNKESYLAIHPKRERAIQKRNKFDGCWLSEMIRVFSSKCFCMTGNVKCWQVLMGSNGRPLKASHIVWSEYNWRERKGTSLQVEVLSAFTICPSCLALQYEARKNRHLHSRLCQSYLGIKAGATIRFLFKLCRWMSFNCHGPSGRKWSWLFTNPSSLLSEK